jgi:hypothetical protein
MKDERASEEGGRAGTGLNQALEPTASSFGCTYAAGGGTGRLGPQAEGRGEKPSGRRHLFTMATAPWNGLWLCRIQELL